MAKTKKKKKSGVMHTYSDVLTDKKVADNKVLLKESYELWMSMIHGTKDEAFTDDGYFERSVVAAMKIMTESKIKDPQEQKMIERFLEEQANWICKEKVKRIEKMLSFLAPRN